MNDRLQQLALFVRTVEAGNFTKAARAFGLSQPSASRAIAALERRLSVKLIARTTRQISLTAAGEALLERAREALAAIDDAENAARGADRLSGVLRVALPPGYGAWRIVPLLPAFLDRVARSAAGIAACAAAGLGVALGSAWMRADGLASGALIELLPDYALDPVAAYIVFPSGRRTSRRSRAFADHLERVINAGRQYKHI